MTIQRTLLALLSQSQFVYSLSRRNASAQSAETYQQMAQPQRAAFVAEQARRIARQMSGRDYQFTASFEV